MSTRRRSVLLTIALLGVLGAVSILLRTTDLPADVHVPLAARTAGAAEQEHWPAAGLEPAPAPSRSELLPPGITAAGASFEAIVRLAVQDSEGRGEAAPPAVRLVLRAADPPGTERTIVLRDGEWRGDLPALAHAAVACDVGPLVDAGGPTRVSPAEPEATVGVRRSDAWLLDVVDGSTGAPIPRATVVCLVDEPDDAFDALSVYPARPRGPSVIVARGAGTPIEIPESASRSLFWISAEGYATGALRRPLGARRVRLE